MVVPFVSGAPVHVLDAGGPVFDDRGMLAEVLIRSEDVPDEVISIGRPTGGPDGFYLVPVRIEAAGLSCSQGAMTYGDDGIRAFFAELARDWRGWRGTRQWHTIEHDLAIEATHTGRKIDLGFTLRPGAYPANWRLVLEMSISPDASLDRLASDIGELFGDL
jgi:hypothetical protein